MGPLEDLSAWIEPGQTRPDCIKGPLVGYVPYNIFWIIWMDKKYCTELLYQCIVYYSYCRTYVSLHWAILGVCMVHTYSNVRYDTIMVLYCCTLRANQKILKA